jgi:hypothetical protein
LIRQFLEPGESPAFLFPARINWIAFLVRSGSRRYTRVVNKQNQPALTSQVTPQPLGKINVE